MYPRLLWIAWLVIAVVAALEGALFIHWGCFDHRSAVLAAEAKPAAFPVELSVAGTYRGPVRHTCRPGHGLDVELVCEPPFPSPQEARTAVEGLGATLAIAAPRQKRPVSVPLDLTGLRERPWSHTSLQPPHSGMFFRYPDPGPVGEYEAVVTVTRPSPAFEGREQRMVLSYALCGVETDLGPVISWVIGAALLLPGAVTAIVVLVRRRRSKAGDQAP